MDDVRRYLEAVVSLPAHRYLGERAVALDVLAIMDGRATFAEDGQFEYLPEHQMDDIVAKVTPLDMFAEEDSPPPT